jgi:peptidoglycan/LPS O-acetylase OafA/YrhL
LASLSSNQCVKCDGKSDQVETALLALRKDQEIRLKDLIPEFRYRAEIDGLRAVAVMAVVLYHAKLGFPGGFVGVDVFFVISGFLITSLILKDLQEGKFTLSNFWERRARRILPALVVVVVFTVVAGWFLLLPDDYEELGRSAAFQAAFAANIDFWRSTGYFAGAAEEKPLLHTWSLAVEEQFYLFVPLILFGLHRSRLLQKRSVLRGGLMGCIILSLIYSTYAVSASPLSAFYLLPSRAWELMLGCLIAVAPAPRLHRFWAVLLDRACLSHP